MLGFKFDQCETSVLQTTVSLPYYFLQKHDWALSAKKTPNNFNIFFCGNLVSVGKSQHPATPFTWQWLFQTMESKCLLWRLLSFTNIYSQLQTRFQLSTDDNQATMKFIKTKRTAVLDIYRFAPQLTASPKMSLLSKKPKMKDLYVQFLQKMLNNDQPSTPHLKMKNIVVYTRSAYTTQKPEEMQVQMENVLKHSLTKSLLVDLIWATLS